MLWWLIFSGTAACFVLAGMWVERWRWEDRIFAAWCWNLPITVYGRRYRIYEDKREGHDEDRSGANPPLGRCTRVDP